ncbi:glycosyl transferase family A [[Phormidium ambiguum] IAM M-71]|uniref:Glycosyl transferase family A n=1 Tax=[Phormidium ambiguum] IAM M-71 TaxID=454136 RepID=A0A1U7IA42_9CYAN|nr:glycosyltransferase [Phormidium ambiguum]OKH33365.1 glycosyl transferase family A [Phormidium ambiguum IAM M-71]
MPLISVIIPVFNSEKTIRGTLESVLKQSFTDLELIVINDGSQDTTLEIINQIKDSRLKVFSYPNAGVSASRNRGIFQAIGEYISFLDSDDLWTSDKLESQLKALQTNPQAGVAYSWTNYIDESGKFLYSGNKVALNGNVYEQLLLQNFIESGSNVLIRKEALNQVGGFDESLFGPEDWDLLIRLAAKYDFVVVPIPQILYRMSANSISSSIYRQEKASLKVIEKAFAQAPEALQHLKKYSISNVYKYLMFRVLVGSLERQKALTAARCFWYAVQNNPGLLSQHSKLMFIVTLKIMAGILLPSKQLQIFFIKFKKLVN